MVYYKSIKIMIDIPSLAEVIINMAVHHYRVLESIIID